MNGSARERVSPVLVLIGAAVIAATDGYAIALWDKTPAIRALALATTLAATGLLVPRVPLDNRRLMQCTIAVAFCAFGFIQWHRTVALYGSGRLYDVAHDLAALLPILGLCIVFGGRRVSASAWTALVTGFACAGVATIRCSPRPLIDVWYFLQHATRCVPHSCNPYTMTTPRSPGVTQGIPYLPGSFLFLAPFRWLFGDVRYGLLVALLLAPLLLQRLMPGKPGRIAGALVLTVPGTLFALEESWIEPLLLVLILGMLVGWQRNSSFIVILTLAGALLTKQHALLLVPLAGLTVGVRRTGSATALAGLSALPWVLASPSAFYRDTVQYFLDLPGRLDALSVWMIAPKQVNAYLPIVVVAAMYGVVWLLRPHTASGFLLAAGLILAGFELTNKISFYNEWALPAMLLLVGTIAVGSEEEAPPQEEISAGLGRPISVG